MKHDCQQVVIRLLLSHGTSWTLVLVSTVTAASNIMFAHPKRSCRL